MEQKKMNSNEDIALCIITALGAVSECYAKAGSALLRQRLLEAQKALCGAAQAASNLVVTDITDTDGEE